MLLKSDMRATLPLEIRLVLPALGLNSWKKFFTAVETVDSEHVQDKIECNARFHRHSIPNIGAETTGFDPNHSGVELYARIQALMANMPPIDTPIPPWTPPVPRTTYPCTMSNSLQPNACRHPTCSTMHHNTLYSRSPVTQLHHSVEYHPTCLCQLADAIVRQPDNTPAAQFVARLLQTPGSPSTGQGSKNSLGGDPICDLALASHGSTAVPGGYGGMGDVLKWPQCACTGLCDIPPHPGHDAGGVEGMLDVRAHHYSPHYGVAKCCKSGAAQIPIKESTVRALVGNTLFPPGVRTPGRSQAGVSQIEADEIEGYNILGMYNVHQMLFEEQEEPES
ncbi:hypothetical protein B0H14DRAFT_2630590 [Mycena olivaceomarginata]|nr:hypothetical protein B0H14DRAFT_2630590 [Mycena olivaceomarginata]